MGKAVETWRENYPYSQRLSREEYELEKYRLQIELLKLQYWAEDTGQKIIVVFEGRRSEEHTSELQSRGHVVCRLLLEKKKKLVLMNGMESAWADNAFTVTFIFGKLDDFVILVSVG